MVGGAVVGIGLVLLAVVIFVNRSAANDEAEKDGVRLHEIRRELTDIQRTLWTMEDNRREMTPVTPMRVRDEPAPADPKGPRHVQADLDKHEQAIIQLKKRQAELETEANVILGRHPLWRDHPERIGTR